MSEIIYLKDILLARVCSQRRKKRTSSGRPKLKPFRYERTMKSSLVERKKKEDGK
ncbi:MAG: hypothetical protein LBT63_03705 [Holosporaceae bacterium]|jgi:hypothetical protein|nr:hypothetical protein [Holosporaceae bacterium]